jgi:microcystin-dependent protein
MPKTKVSEYSTTPSSNSDMAGIDISEGCSPAGINDAIRAGMSHLKKMDDGTDAMTSPVFTTATISGGSIDGTTVGATTASTGDFTDLTADTFTLNSVAIGSTDFTKLAGITVTATEINSLDGASSEETMQEQMDNKAPLASPALTGTPTAPEPTAGDSSTQIATTAFVGTQVASSTPAGAVLSFAMNTAPTGWLECDGAALDRTTYETLFTAIGTTFGEGDGSTTFNIPDLRGVFVRGWANTKLNAGDDGIYDAGRNFGTEQADAFKSHSHTFKGATGSSGSGTSSRDSVPETQDTGQTGDIETRPRNVALMYCIKT